MKLKHKKYIDNRLEYIKLSLNCRSVRKILFYPIGILLYCSKIYVKINHLENSIRVNIHISKCYNSLVSNYICCGNIRSHQFSVISSINPNSFYYYCDIVWRTGQVGESLHSFCLP